MHRRGMISRSVSTRRLACCLPLGRKKQGKRRGTVEGQDWRGRAVNGVKAPGTAQAKGQIGLAKRLLSTWCAGAQGIAPDASSQGAPCPQGAVAKHQVAGRPKPPPGLQLKPPPITANNAPTVSFQLQRRLQRLCNRRLLFPNWSPNRVQSVSQTFAALLCGHPLLQAQGCRFPGLSTITPPATRLATSQMPSSRGPI